MTYTETVYTELDPTELEGFALEGFGLTDSGVETFDANPETFDTETFDTRVDADAGTEMLGVEAAFLLSTDTWTDEALCRTVAGASDLFFSEELPEIAQAKRICGGCPVIGSCLEGALDRAEPCGVWGGQLFVNGRIVEQKRRRGRPRKVPRPEDILPQIPVPEYLQDRVATAATAA